MTVYGENLNQLWRDSHLNRPQFGLSCSRSSRIVYNLGHTPASSAHNPRITADRTMTSSPLLSIDMTKPCVDTFHDLTIWPWLLLSASYSGSCWTEQTVLNSGCCVEAGAELAQST